MTNWIAVSVDLDDDPKVAALAAALGCHRDTAAMRLVRLWGRMARHHVEAGDLSHVDDDTLEEWAGWRGKRGRFAKEFRSAFMDEAGIVNGWWRWNGRLLRKARMERERKRRLQGVDVPPERPAETPRKIRGSSKDNTSTRPNHTTHHSAEGPPVPFASLVNRMAREPDRWAVTEFLEGLPAGEKPDAWAKFLGDCLEGLDLPGGRPATTEQVAAVCRDFRRMKPHQFTFKWFRTCLTAFIRDGEKGAKATDTATDRTIRAAEAFARGGPPEAA